MNISSEISARAAAWISRLNADDSTGAERAACREWLNADPRHRAAFELANRMWEDASTLPASLAGNLPLGAERKQSLRMRWAATTGVAVAVFAGVLLYMQSPQQLLETRTGQQLTVPLEDGSRLFLNTDTRVRVRFDKHTRRIKLESGEALFEVAKDSSRPFIVTVEDRDITALGTQFVVRHDDTKIAVTLVEGKVSVSGGSRATLPASDDGSSATRPAGEGSNVTILHPGERVTIAPQRLAVVDQPAIDTVTAWRRGEIIFENTPLSTAIEEMNRYSVRKLKLDASAPAQIAVSGLFRSGDVENFALALTNTHPLEAIEYGSAIEIRAR